MNKTQTFHEALVSFWDKKNGAGDFEEMFTAEFEPGQQLPEDAPIVYSLDMMIIDQQLELLFLFCKKHNVQFSITPSADVHFHIKNFKP